MAQLRLFASPEPPTSSRIHHRSCTYRVKELRREASDHQSWPNVRLGTRFPRRPFSLTIGKAIPSPSAACSARPPAPLLPRGPPLRAPRSPLPQLSTRLRSARGGEEADALRGGGRAQTPERPRGLRGGRAARSGQRPDSPEASLFGGPTMPPWSVKSRPTRVPPLALRRPGGGDGLTRRAPEEGSAGGGMRPASSRGRTSEWAQTGSNCRPQPCKGRALPTELCARGGPSF